MTVAELIAELSKFDRDATVCMDSEDGMTARHVTHLFERSTRRNKFVVLDWDYGNVAPQT